MAKPNECKWCCAEKIASPRPPRVYFGCWTKYDPGTDTWYQDADCVNRMVAQAKILREQVRRAIEAIRAANRYYLLGEVALIPDETGNLTQACVLDDVAAILEGESDGETE